MTDAVENSASGVAFPWRHFVGLFVGLTAWSLATLYLLHSQRQDANTNKNEANTIAVAEIRHSLTFISQQLADLKTGVDRQVIDHEQRIRRLEQLGRTDPR